METMRQRILVVDPHRECSIGAKAALESKETSLVLASNAQQAIGLLKKGSFDLVLCSSELPDKDGLTLLEVEKQKYPGTDFVLLAHEGSIEGAVEAIHRGASNYLPKPIDPDVLKSVVQKVLERRALREEVQYLKGQLHERYGMHSIITRSPAMEGIFKKIRAVARTDSTVLIHGETGVGKELVANVIHLHSPRKKGRFLAINCGALPDTLLESELFGYEKGAFTGAHSQKRGKFEIASGGTVFLDEISTISPAMQVKLLRVLQERKFERLGGHESVSVDVRIVCATNRDLKALVSDGGFRDDLYYRVNVFPIDIPALRERREDIPILAAHFLKKIRSAMKKKITGISEEVMNALMRYDWPGNIRELENLIERAVILEDSQTLTASSFPPEIMGLEPHMTEYDESLPLEEARQQVIERFEKEYFTRLLDRYRGKIADCAKHAGITPRSIHAKMQKYTLYKEDFKQKK
jgi:two-component system NtrC family response regulator